jgi:hypothetical protein
MQQWVPSFFANIAYIHAFFAPRHKLALEAAALRQQLAMFKRKKPRPWLDHRDPFFWTALRRLYSGWADALNPRLSRKRQYPGTVNIPGNLSHPLFRRVPGDAGKQDPSCLQLNHE